MADQTKIDEDIKDIGDHFDKMQADIQALRDAQAAGDDAAAQAATDSIEAKLSVLRAKFDATDAPVTGTTGDASTDVNGTQSNT